MRDFFLDAEEIEACVIALDANKIKLRDSELCPYEEKQKRFIVMDHARQKLRTLQKINDRLHYCHHCGGYHWSGHNPCHEIGSLKANMILPDVKQQPKENQ